MKSLPDSKPLTQKGQQLADLFAERIVYLDGAMGTMLQRYQLTEEDFAWVTLRLMELADRHADGRVVSVLEGGYDLAGLASSAGIHIQALMKGTGEAKGITPDD